MTTSWQYFAGVKHLTKVVILDGETLDVFHEAFHNVSSFLRWAKVHARSLPPLRNTENRKADAAEHFEVFDHVGLLVNESPGTAELLFI
jgi:hypothetical protein